MSSGSKYVVTARATTGFRVWLCFDDGLEGEVDLAAELWGPVFEPLKAPGKFAEFRVERTLVWPNGADFAPEFLYEEVARQGHRAA